MHVANTLKASNTMQQTHAVCGELAHRMAKCDIGKEHEIIESKTILH